jgi:anaerobic dimethyl sulfoxide reductase subunit A
MNCVPFFCGKDCGGDACPLLACVEDGQVRRVINNPAGGKFLKGCRRGFDMPLEEYAPDRLLTPLIRTGRRGSGQFRQASWDEALDLTASQLGETKAKYGANSILNLSSAGSIGALHSTFALLGRFLNLFGGCTRLTGSYSNGAARFILPYLLGSNFSNSGFDPATMQYSNMIILWGANLLETRQGSEVPQRLVQAKKRGAKIVVIDPRRSATVKQAATWWIPIRPGTDAALMLAVLYVLIDGNLLDRPFINAHSSGFEELEAYVLGKTGSPVCTPQWAEQICGVSSNEIIHFGRAYAAAKPAMLFPGYSIQRVYAGEETYRLTVALQLATGNFGKLGGSTGSINSFLPGARVGKLETPSLPDQPEAPTLRWPDAVLQGKAGGYPTDIHAIYNVGANFLNQGSDIPKNIAAFEKVDFSVSHSIFLTPTARYCDVVLPAATALEKEDVGLPWLGNYLLYKPQIIPPRGQARNDYDILCDLAGRLGFGQEYSEGRSAAEWVQAFIADSEIPDADEFRRSGIYLASDQERVGLADFSANPQKFPLDTPSGKVEIASRAYQNATAGPAFPGWQAPPCDDRYPLQLISPKSALRTHSQGSNIAEIQKKEAHCLTMHPADAAKRGIKTGELVLLHNEQGKAHLLVRLSEDIVPGVVCLPEGRWADLDNAGIETGGSANMFTSTTGTAASLSAIMHGVGVEVKKIHT